MGWISAIFGKQMKPYGAPQKEVAVGASDASVMTYNDKSITFTGDLTDYDYNSILRDKQRNITRLYELSDYFVDADPIYRGIIRGVYTPFAMHTPYRLVGANEKTKQKYQEYYERIHLHDRMRSIFFQYFKYGNVFVY